MTSPIAISCHDGVACLAVNNPPVNALSHAVRHALWDAVTDAIADVNVNAIVLVAEGRTFPAGADISEFGKPLRQPDLPSLINLIEASPKPVVAGLHGTALGGGFELSLGAHVRLAALSTKVGLPEVTLGVLPGAGGTQRVPRLIGPRHALGMMLSGGALTGEQATELGLIGGVVQGDLLSACIRLAAQLAQNGTDLVQTRDRRDGMENPAEYMSHIAQARAGLTNPDLIAPAKIIDCIEAALLLPFDAGLAFERAAFEQCRESDVSRALRHAFFAERKASKLPGLRGVTPRNIDAVAIIGGGTMGAGIALACLKSGLNVFVKERDDAAATAADDRVRAVLDRDVEKTRMSAIQRGEHLTRFAVGIDIDPVSDADLVIEAVPEDMALKSAVMAELGRVAAPGAILATNTSYLDVNTLAHASGRPTDVIGLHFFSPAHIMKLLEIVIGDQTAPDVQVTGLALARRLGKSAVPSGVADGFIGNAILNAYRTACDHMLEDGASLTEIDSAMRAFGFKLGPYQVLDMAGLDISWARRQRLAKHRDPLERYVKLGDVLCEAGRLGQKTGAGYYVYPEGSRTGVPDPVVDEMLVALRHDNEITNQNFTKTQIQTRALLAMVNTGAHLIDTEIARRPGDVDVVMMLGYGFPRWHGGPMQWADATGLLHLRNLLTVLADNEDSKFWAPSPIFERLIKNGQKFADLN